MPPKRRMDGQSVYDLPTSTNDEEPQPTPSGQEDATTPFNPTENEDQTTPHNTAPPPLPNPFAAPPSPAYGSDDSDGGGYIDGKNTKKHSQKIRWDARNQRHITMFGFGRTVSKTEHSRIANSFNERPTPKSVEVYFTKKRADLRKLVVQSGICHPEDANGILKRKANQMSEADEVEQDAVFGREPMVWGPEADAQLMLFGLGRRLTGVEEGRIARVIPGRPTRREVRERSQLLVEERDRLLKENGIKVPPVSPRRRLETTAPSDASPDPFTDSPPPPPFSPNAEALPPSVLQQMQLASELEAAKQALQNVEEAQNAAAERVRAAEKAQAEMVKARMQVDDGEEDEDEELAAWVRSLED